MKLGEKIKLIRTEQELTQPQLAEKAGIEQSYLSKLENDKGVPSFEIITRIALSLNMAAMELIDSLSQSYVEENLAHIPEGSAQYATIRYKRERHMKLRFIIAFIVIVIGIGLFVYDAFSSKSLWYYESDGVVKDGEMLMKFSPLAIEAISETYQEREARLKNNKDSIDHAFVVTDVYKGNQFQENVAGGRRLFVHMNTLKGEAGFRINIQSVIGIMLALAGLFAFLFNIRFKQK